MRSQPTTTSSIAGALNHHIDLHSNVPNPTNTSEIRVVIPNNSEQQSEQTENDTNSHRHRLASATYDDNDKEKAAKTEADNDNNDNDWPIFDPMSGPYSWSTYKKDWRQIKNEFLAGIIVAFAQIPETVAYAFLAKVDPIEGLQATWIVGFITAFFGGRTTMISGATGAIAAVLATLPSKNHIYPVIILSGIIITFCAVFKLTKFARLIPHSAMIGFLNGLAIIITESQIHIFAHTHGIELILMIVASVIVAIVVYALPRLTKAIPSSLAGILIAVCMEYVIFRIGFGIHTLVIGDLGELSGSMPVFLWMRDDLEPIEWNMNVFIQMLIPSFWITLVAISEDVMTIDVVSEMTNTRPKTEEAEKHQVRQQIMAMGVSNIISGLLGTMGGGSTIGASIIACFQGSNGRYRITGVVTALSVLFIVLVGHSLISAVPASALVGIIMCTVHHTFEYESIFIILWSMMPMKMRECLQKNVYKKSLRKIERADAFVIVLVTFLTLISNLGIAISAGLVYSCLVYAWQSRNLKVSTECVEVNGKKIKIYHLDGPLFFGNARSVVSEFAPESDPNDIEIHCKDAQIYDYSAINAINTIANKYKKRNKSVHLKHIAVKSQKLIQKAHHIANFTYDTTLTVSENGKFSLDEPLSHHIEQYPK